MNKKHNKGEWSELYATLFLLIKPNMVIVDENFKTINDSIFWVDEIISNAPFDLHYKIKKDGIYIYMDNELYRSLSQEQIDEARKLLLNSILMNSDKSGSFEIQSIQSFLDEFSNGILYKGDSHRKEDLRMTVFDELKETKVMLGYSVKSSLGKPPTILNASNHTNFKYEILNFDDDKMHKINSIQSDRKLKDRINEIDNLGGTIEYRETISDQLRYNLAMVDTNMHIFLGNALLEYYRTGERNLEKLFMEANHFEDEFISKKKLADLLENISFGFFPSERWDGIKNVNGGIIIVQKEGDVVVLDLVYNEETVRQYLVNETRLDSPSSSRYHMLEVFKEKDRYYFTLNLQIRYKH